MGVVMAVKAVSPVTMCHPESNAPTAIVKRQKSWN
jgi:hypothetical protein